MDANVSNIMKGKAPTDQYVSYIDSKMMSAQIANFFMTKIGVTPPQVGVALTLSEAVLAPSVGERMQLIKAAVGIGGGVAGIAFIIKGIPSTALRHFADRLFPMLAKCAAADSVASGYMHRWVGGHDLILNVFNTASHDGVRSGLHQAGHILLTDFPTKAGIPIPLPSALPLSGTDCLSVDKDVMMAKKQNAACCDIAFL